jgi:nitrogen fixation/metabolism regulation signal transduction histidine kinase
MLPGVLIYGVSYQFVSRSIESWFDVQVEGALEAGLNLGRTSLDTLASDLSSKARVAAGQISDIPSASPRNTPRDTPRDTARDTARDTPQITVGELAARFLEACGVRAAFGVISIHNMPILDAFHVRQKIRFVSARGEAGRAVTRAARISSSREKLSTL